MHVKYMSWQTWKVQ